MKQPYPLARLGLSIWLARRSATKVHGWKLREIDDAITFARRCIRNNSLDLSNRGKGSKAKARARVILAKQRAETICIADYLPIEDFRA